MGLYQELEFPVKGIEVERQQLLGGCYWPVGKNREIIKEDRKDNVIWLPESLQGVPLGVQGRKCFEYRWLTQEDRGLAEFLGNGRRER